MAQEQGVNIHKVVDSGEDVLFDRPTGIAVANLLLGYKRVCLPLSYPRRHCHAELFVCIFLLFEA